MNDTAGSCDLSRSTVFQDFDAINTWSERIKFIIGGFGLLGNTLGIPLLFKIGNIFNVSLACLAIVDNLVIVLDFIQEPIEAMSQDVLVPQKLAYAIFRESAFASSLLITAALAYERHYAISKPIEYHTEISPPGRKPWKR